MSETTKETAQTPRSLDGLVGPRYVYRLEPTSSDNLHTYEIGECDNPRSYEGWCDRRVCEGFWGNEELCRRTVNAMNQPNATAHVRDRSEAEGT